MKQAMKVEVDCANCAAKIEDAVSKIDGVHSARVNFMTQKLILDADTDRWNDILEEVKKTGKKVDSDFELNA